MSRRGFAVRVGLWLAFLVGALAMPLIYLADPPTPVGSGLLQVFGWGAIAGVAVGLLIQFLYLSVLSPRGKVRRFKYMAGAAILGAFGGAGGAALLDAAHVTRREAIELPLVRIQYLPGRRAGRAQLATLEPVDPTREKGIALRRVPAGEVAAARAGNCIHAQLERGRLGGTWMSDLKIGGCSPIRGRPSTHVLVLQGFRSWRWHGPRVEAQAAVSPVMDAALPPELSCRTRAGAWLYRCTLGSGEKSAQAGCWQRPRHWPHPDAMFIGAGSGGLMFYEIEVRPNGTLTFNGEEVDTGELQRLLSLAEQLQPVPPLVLRTGPSSDCRIAEWVRAAMDRQPMCRSGHCFESDRWQELGFPTFAAHSNRFAEIEGKRR